MTNFNAVRHVSLCVFISCAAISTLIGCQGQGDVSRVHLEAPRSQRDIKVDTKGPEPASSLRQGSHLFSLARKLDLVAITRSPAIQDRSAALAQLRVTKSNFYPQLVPSASLPLGGKSASLGLSIEQTLWDGGRSRADVSDGKLAVAHAEARAWMDRNEAILAGLLAFVDVLKYRTQVAINSDLEADLAKLDALLRIRMEGGVADRGEQLRMASSLQAVRREALTFRSALSEAEAKLTRLLPAGAQIPSTRTLSELAASCDFDTSSSEYPQLWAARVHVQRAKAAEQSVLSRRFPRLILGTGISYEGSGTTSPGVGIRIDASDVLGVARSSSIDAARSASKSAELSFQVVKEDIEAKILSLQGEYATLLSELTQIQQLENINKETTALFGEQVSIGTVQATDGIAIHREVADTLQAKADLDARVIGICLELSALKGTLVQPGEYNE